jgi:FkbH-like protein
MKDLKFSELIRLNNELGLSLKEKERIDIRILANITVNQLKPVLEYTLRREGLNAEVGIADYDNILQESASLEKKQIPVIFWELCNTTDSFVYEIESFSDEVFNDYLNKVKNELSMLFGNLKSSSLVIFNRFSHLIYSRNNLKPFNFERFVTTLNDFLLKNAPPNFLVVDSDKVFSGLPFEQSIDPGSFYSTKTLYTVGFFKSYAPFIVPVLFATYGKTKKAVILDCDNTLWKGVVGEDGWENIALSEKHKYGIYFKEVQLLMKALAKRGIILGICSKNNAADVEEVFEKREDMILKSDDIVIKKINWNDKASNLQEIAKELNIGIESLVFIDDSNFEINLVKDRLPMVKTIQVPEKLSEYPRVILENLPLFFTLNTTEEDLQRVKMYKEDIQRSSAKDTYQNIDDYLGSLGIEVVIANNEQEVIERVTQLTQKTNQFNLTTRRVQIGEMQQLYDAPDHDVLNLSVSDKYGNSGLTGVCIVKYEGETASIDTLLLSCRILGRNIETVFLREIIGRIHERGAKLVTAAYKKTPKNGQVEKFYDKNGFSLLTESETERTYEADCNAFLSRSEPLNYIKVIWKKE